MKGRTDLDDSGNVIDLAHTRVSIREMLGGVPGARPEQSTAAPERIPSEEPADTPTGDGLDLNLPDVLDPLPKPGDPYKAHARAANKPVLSLLLVQKDGVSVRGFSYGNLDTIDRLPGEKPDSGPVLVLRFTGLTPTEVRLSGRNLATLFIYLSQHRVAWVREQQAERDFSDEAVAVVGGISIKPID
jgi:hypothetical protein